LDPQAVKKFLTPASAPVIARVRAMVEKLGVNHSQEMEKAFRELAEELGVKLVGVAQPVRVALTGRTASPGIFEVMGILGAASVLARLDRALNVAKTGAQSPKTS